MHLGFTGWIGLIYPTPGPAGWYYEEDIFFVDNDSDMVNVTWDWGDGTSTSQLLQGLTLDMGGVVTSSNHSWSNDTIKVPGRGEYFVNFTMNITLSDGVNPTVVCPVNVSVFFGFNWPPYLKFMRASANTVSTFDPVDITVIASDYEGEALTWTIDYGDASVDVFHTASTASDENVTSTATHTFVARGNYTVVVYVTDSVPPYQTGYHNVSAYTIIHVVENRAPVAASNISISAQMPVIQSSLGYVNVTFCLDVFDEDGDALTAVWDLGDGALSTNTTAGGLLVFELRQARQFTETGNHTVSVTVTDGLPGHEIHRNLTFHVTSDNRPPYMLLNFTYPTMGYYAIPNESIVFTLAVYDRENDIISVSWDFGDGTPVESFNLTEYVENFTTILVSHAFADCGEYNVIIRYTDNMEGYLNHNLFDHFPVNVIALVFAQFSTEQTSVSYGNLVQFDASSSHSIGGGAFTYRWDWDGDGVWDTVWLTDPIAYNLFDTAGTYNVTLEVRDSSGGTGTSSQTITVTDTVIPELSSPFVLAAVCGLMIPFVIGLRRRK